MMADDQNPFTRLHPSTPQAREESPFYETKPSVPAPVSNPLTGMEVAKSAYEHLGPSAVKAAQELVYPFTHTQVNTIGFKDDRIWTGVKSSSLCWIRI
jgi:hypothetical protein